MIHFKSSFSYDATTLKAFFVLIYITSMSSNNLKTFSGCSKKIFILEGKIKTILCCQMFYTIRLKLQSNKYHVNDITAPENEVPATFIKSLLTVGLFVLSWKCLLRVLTLLFGARLQKLQQELEFLEVQEEYIKDEQKNLKKEFLHAQEEVKRIQSIPLVIGQFLEAVDQNTAIVGSTTGKPSP